MKFVIPFISIICFVSVKAQVEEFEDTTLLYLNYVDPQACDYPHNLAFFHTYDEFETLRYRVQLSKDSLHAWREFHELNYDEDSVLRRETIRVHFGSSNDFRQITFAEYKLQGLEFFDEETDQYSNNWLIHHAQIDYEKDSLYYRYQRDDNYAVMEIEIAKPTVENIDFLMWLCYFYRNEDQERTRFKIEEDE